MTRVRKFLDAQLVFMPGLRAYLLSSGSTIGNDDITSRPEAVLLNLPSSIPSTHHSSVCVPGLPEIENRLRYAQAMEALSGLRRQLRTRVMASKLNDKNASSQRAYVRSRALQDQVEGRVRLFQRQYNTARAALLILRGAGDWENQLAVLKPEDVRGMSERAMTEEEKEEHQRVCRMAGWSGDGDVHDVVTTPVVRFDPRLALGEGQRTLSWIWYTVSEQELQGNSKEMQASEYTG
jgi:hypothetical protein